MKKIFFVFLIFAAVQSFGQTGSRQIFTVASDSVSGGSLTVELDDRISDLVDPAVKRNCPKTRFTPPRKLTPAEKCASQNKIIGYKIQIFYTKDRNAAERVRADFARQNPGYTAELVYLAPDYRVLVGDYFTRKSAGPDLRKIQRTYPAAFAVQWRVWCRKAL